MFIFRSVVGKLWLTIIGLVGVVLLILGFFLVNYLENYFSQANDQKDNMEKLAVKFSEEASHHMYNEQFYQLSNELLGFQDARMLVISTDLKEMVIPSTQGSPLVSFHASDFYTGAELRQVFAGQTISKQINKTGLGRLKAGDEYLVVAVPLKNLQGNIVGATLLYQSLQSLEATQSYMLRLFIYVSIVGFLMTTFFAFFLFSRITRPLQQLKKAADFITMGEYGTRVPIQSKDEIGELAKTFNHMGEKMQESIRALSQEKEHLSSILRSMTDAVITLDANGSVMLTNPQGEKIVQEWSTIEWSEDDEETRRFRKPDTALGDWGLTSYNNPYSSPIPVPLIPLFEAVVDESSEAATKLHVQNGVWSVAMTPLYTRDQVRGAVAVLRNVTEEERLDKLRKDFVANVSHELRTPLSMLQGYSEALLDDIPSTPEERVELVQVIHDESLRMGRLVRDLLDLARMEANHLELDFREVEVDSLVKRMHRKFSVLAKERGIALSAALPEEPLILQRGDEDRLEQVLTNLLDNAFRHTASGARIAMKAEPAVYKDQPAIRIEVSDEGQGIPADDLPFIFERFYKADKARTRGSSGGTGLGLAIVKNIIEAHYGSVTAQSIVGQGTTFTLLLPCGPK
ncbi:two-component system, OmpR family, sensor histidine kinase ResE [Paenibacillus sp. yr247]|uniref:ATP-binding protein n=1 Tax=Paenibacillus sp. yr247 TaxID=1761880 RepID=UPI000886DA3B|nr:ATP-binding protein [Paenibacillus sp. yr247]SDN88494.1 two-component system, OmpR family, sensor histidine kinase ResE [Paenibacillus sp. yr247]